MTTTISDSVGHKRGEGKNLAIITRYAKDRGVVNITIEKLDWGQAQVTVLYQGGWKATTKFADHSVACEWATARSKLGRNSWFSGCEVILKD